MTKYPAESYTKEECEAILQACYDSSVAGRNQALIVMMWRSGLRLAEALDVMPYDIGWDRQTIRVRHGKGDRARTVGFDVGAKGYLRQWSYERDWWQNVTDESPFICTQNGGPVEQAYVRAALPRLARKAGVKKRIHAHGFRHTFAVELAREGVSMVNIQRLLGHSSLGTTSVYLASLSPEEALNAVRGREW